MKKAIMFTVIMSLALLLSACSAKSDETVSESQTQSAAETVSSEASATQTAETARNSLNRRNLLLIDESEEIELTKE